MHYRLGFRHAAPTVIAGLVAASLFSATTGCRMLVRGPLLNLRATGGGAGGNGGGATGQNVVPGAHGLTFGYVQGQGGPQDVVLASCHGEPKGGDQLWNNSCNPYKGDTSCAEAHPILCIRIPGGEPSGELPSALQEHWSGGELASTLPVPGTQLTSPSAADAICAQAFGQGFRMAEFHDGHNGWMLAGKIGQLDSSQRSWVNINDQPGNCWNSAQ
jgi:hypothetical protein